MPCELRQCCDVPIEDSDLHTRLTASMSLYSSPKPSKNTASIIGAMTRLFGRRFSYWPLVLARQGGNALSAAAQVFAHQSRNALEASEAIEFLIDHISKPQ